MNQHQLTHLVITCAASLIAFTSAHAQTLVGTATALQNAINAGDTNIQLSANITGVTTPIDIGTGSGSASTLTINGAGFNITGSSQIFFVQTGNVTLHDITLSGNAVGGNGGTGYVTGGGALGAGGAIFVGSGATVTTNEISLLGNSATGGNGGGSGGNSGSGGGGMNGGTGGEGDGDGGGGGGGNGGNGGEGTNLNGGGGGGLQSNGSNSTNSQGGNGGSYAGGGGGDGNGGAGGFGGGGGGGVFGGGNGGFGAGGGGGASGSAGGVGGAAGNGPDGGGGGGAGLGGAIFVQSGGTLIMTGQGATVSSSITAGTGGAGAGSGAAAGSDLFLMTGSTTTLAPGPGAEIDLKGTIADDSATGLPSGGSYTPGTASGAVLDVGNPSSEFGTVELDGANTYSGGTILNWNTTLIAGNANALGTGAIAVDGGELELGNGNHTLNATAYSQTPQGDLVLSIAGTGQAATPDQLVITNASHNDVNLAGNLSVELGSFTLPSGVHSGTYTFTLVTTTNGYNSEFTNLFLTGGPHGVHGTLDYTTDDIILDLSFSNLLSGFATAGLTSNQQAVLAPINRNLAAGNSGAGFTAFTNALTPYSASPSTLGPVLDQLSVAKFNQFASTTAFNNASFDTQAQDDYLAGLRTGAHGSFAGGSGSIDASQLMVGQPGVDPTLTYLHSRLLAWNPPDTMSDVASPLLGGVDMNDPKAMRTCNECQPTNPWNVFVRGNVILAQGFSQGDTPHFDDNTESVTVGADYRLTPNFLVGVAANYAHTDATIDTFNSSATVDSYSPGIYAAYADHGWYANFQGRYSYNSYSEDRSVEFLHQNPNGSTNGNEGVVDLDGGYEFHHGAWTYGPLAGLQYTHLTVNGFTEQGSLADLNVLQDQSDSLRSRLGFSLGYAICTPSVCLTPHLSASWQHEFMDQSRGITSQFDDFGGGSFAVRTPGSSDDSALVALGLDAKVNKSITVFGDYTVQAGQDNYFGQSVQAGLKIGF